MSIHDKRFGRLSPRRWTLAFHLLVFLFFPLLVGLGVLGWYGIGQIGKLMEERLQEDVEIIARSMQESIRYSLERDREGSIQQTLEGAFEFGRVYGAYLYDNNGQLIAQSGRVATRPAQDVERLRIIEDGIATGLYATMEGEPLYSFFVPIRDPFGAPLGLLQVARHQDEIQSSLLQMKRKWILYLTFSGVFLATLLLAGYYFAIGRSLPELHRTMLAVRQGDRNVRASTDGPREISDLARSFNATLDAMDRKEAEIYRRRQQEKKLRQRLVQSEKLAALGEVSGAIAHEIGTPLAIIDGKAQRGLRNGHDAEASVQLMEDIRHEVKRLEKFVQQLITFQREDKASDRTVPLAGLWESALEAAKEKAGECAHIRYLPEDEEKEVTVRGDPVRIELAMKNLLQNALQAAGPEGTVEYGWYHRFAGPSLFVRDSGSGVPEEQRSKIWEPFHSTKDNLGGMGLGLALVSRIMEQHGGRAYCNKSALGGAEFVLEFPAANSKANESKNEQKK